MLKNLLLPIAFFFTLLIPQWLSAQLSKEDVGRFLEGHWEGAFIKESSYQKFEISFYQKDSAWESLQVIEEWHPQFGEFQIAVEIDSTGRITFGSGYGPLEVQMDTSSLELSGRVKNTHPSIYVHFKKVPAPPASPYEIIPVDIPNGAVNLKGHLHYPSYTSAKTAVIIVGGRGCYAGATQYSLYAKMLNPYGISTLAYNKRGTGKSTGDCQTATIEDLAKDVVAIKKYLEAHPNGYENIGVIGSSAGGWVMMKASEYTDFDFFISLVGPSTTVREQQMQSLEEGVKEFKLSPKAREELIDYTNLVFDAKPTEKDFQQFQTLLQSAETGGWRQLLEATDIPNSRAEIPQLWVQRHGYDPSEALKKCQVPFLAIYGGKDWIVPYRENVARLEELFTGDRKKYLTTVVAPEAGHSTEFSGEYKKLPNDDPSLPYMQSYWRFFNVSPYPQIEMIRFLQQNNWVWSRK
ncbi:MAG: alpha/beta hydrolase [Bacteroidota bacterium]